MSVRTISQWVPVTRRALVRSDSLAALIGRWMAHQTRYMMFPPSQSGPPSDISIAVAERERGAVAWDEPIYLEDPEEWAGIYSFAEKFPWA